MLLSFLLVLIFAVSCRVPTPISEQTSLLRTGFRALVAKYKREKNHKELKLMYQKWLSLRRRGKLLPTTQKPPHKHPKDVNEYHIKRLQAQQRSVLRRFVNNAPKQLKVRVGRGRKHINYLDRISFFKAIKKPMELVHVFLRKHPLWGTNTLHELYNCKELNIKRNIVLTCKRRIKDCRVKNHFLRFFIEKQVKGLRLIRIIASWRNLDAGNAPNFTMNTQQVKKLIHTKHPRLRLRAALEKVFVFDRTKKKWRPCWEVDVEELGTNYHSGHLVVFDDSREYVLSNNDNHQSCPYTKVARVHAFSPTNMASQQTSLCLLPNANVEEWYDQNNCGGCQCNGVRQTTSTDSVGSVSFFLTSSCTTASSQGCSAGLIRYLASGTRTTNLNGESNFTTYLSNVEVGRPYVPSCGGNSPSPFCLCGNGTALCRRDGVAFDTYYHINYFLGVVSNLLYGNIPNNIDFEVVASASIGGGCGKWTSGKLFVTRDRNGCFGVPPLQVTGDYPFEWNYGTTYHEMMHGLAIHWNIWGGGNITLPNDNEPNAAEEARANYVASSMSHFTRGHAVTRKDSPMYRTYPQDFNCVANCPGGVAIHNGNPCQSHWNGMIWENAFMNMEKLIGKRPSLDMVMGYAFFTNIQHAKFVDEDDFEFSTCMSDINSCSPIIVSGGGPVGSGISHYKAMLAANNAWYGGRYTLDIWNAFNSMLTRSTCLTPPDDFGNHRGAAHMVDLRTFNVSSHPALGWSHKATAINYVGDRDYFFFYLPIEKTVSIVIDPSQIDLTARVYKPDAMLLTSNSGTSITMNATSVSSGWHVLSIEQTPGTSVTTGNYTVSFNNSSLDKEPDNRDGDATPILIDNTAFSANISAILEKDTFRFFATSPVLTPTTPGSGKQKYTITVTPASTLKARVSLYDDTGVKVREETSNIHGDVVTFDEELDSGRWFYVEVNSLDNTVGSYTLQVKADQEDTEIQSPYYTLSTGQNVTLKMNGMGGAFELQRTGPNSRVVAKIKDSGRRFYKFLANKHDQIIVETSNIADTFPSTTIADTILRIYPERFHRPPTLNTTHIKPGTRGLLVGNTPNDRKEYMDSYTSTAAYLSEDDDGAIELFASRIQLVAPRTGWYIVSVEPYNSSSHNKSYQINLTINSGAANILSIPAHSCN